MEPDLQCSGEDIVEKFKTRTLMFEEKSWPEGLMSQLDVLRQTGMLSDVTVVVSEVRFTCHRVVLAAACPYFQALFRHDFQAQSKVELCLESVSPVGFQMILDFMYTSKLQVSLDSMIDLIETADFLQYRNIVRACCDVLLQNITDDNVVALNQLSVAHLCQPLAEATDDYIRSNFARVSMTKDFLSLSPELMKHFVSTYKIFMPEMDANYNVINSSLCHWASQFDERFLRKDTPVLGNWGCSKVQSETCCDHLTDKEDCTDPLVETFRLFHSRSQTVEVLVVIPGEASGKNEVLISKRNMRNIYYYHPQRNHWFVLTELPFYNRMFFSVTTLGNTLYICGGEKKFDMPTRRVNAYSIDDGSWLSQVEPMVKPRSNHSASTAGGLVYVIGGRGSSDNDLWNDGEVYNPKTDQWTLLPSIPGVAGLARCSFVPLGGQLYVFGGMESYVSTDSRDRSCVSKDTRDRRVFRGAYRYHLEHRRWTACLELAAQIEERKVSVGVGDSFVWRGFLLIIDEDKRGRKIQLFNPVTGEMTDFINSNGQHRFGGYALMDDTLYCTGGMVEYFECHDLVHCTSLLGKPGWQFLTPLPCSLSHHFCTVMSKVLDES